MSPSLSPTRAMTPERTYRWDRTFCRHSTGVRIIVVQGRSHERLEDELRVHNMRLTGKVHQGSSLQLPDINDIHSFRHPKLSRSAPDVLVGPQALHLSRSTSLDIFVVIRSIRRNLIIWRRRTCALAVGRWYLSFTSHGNQL